MTTQIKDLPDILDEIIYDEAEDVTAGKIEDLVSEKMPGYDVYTWDADEQGVVDFAEEYTAIIGREVNQGHQIEDIQFSEWISDDNTLVLVVIAIKTK